MTLTESAPGITETAKRQEKSRQIQVWVGIVFSAFTLLEGLIFLLFAFVSG